MLHWYAALRSIASVDVHVPKKHRPSAVGGKEFLCSQAAAGTGCAAKLRRLVKTCSLFHDSEFWSWLVILHLVSIFVQHSFCSASICLSRTYYKSFALGMDSNSWETAVVWDLPQHKWFEEGGEKTRSFTLSSNLVKRPPLLWFGPMMGVWCLFLQEPGSRGRTLCVGWKPCPVLVEEPVLVWGGMVPNCKLYFCPIRQLLEVQVHFNDQNHGNNHQHKLNRWLERKNINQKWVRSLSASKQWNCCWVRSQLQVDHGTVSDSNCTSLSHADFLRDA